MSKKTNADALAGLSAKLASAVISPESPGKAEAEEALKKAEGNTTAKKKSAKSGGAKEKTPPKPKPKVAPEGKAQNVGISLHPVDQDRVYDVADALRKAGIRKMPNVSVLIKVALAAFKDPGKGDLLEIFEKVLAQDGRRGK